MVEFTVPSTAHGQRADLFLAAQFPDYTRSAVAQLFDGRVTINASPVKAGHKLRTNESLRVDASVLHEEIPEIALPVLYEDEDVLVINKPAGILTHAKGGLVKEATVASFIKPKIKFKPLTNRSGIVHRLDRATSGVIVCAKHADAHKWLQKQFSSRKVKKQYVAIVEGTLEHPTAVIDAPIGRNPRRPQSFTVTKSGKPAQTKYIVESTEDNCSRLLLEPVTGRTHQLRVHLHYIGHPIIGDQLYNGRLHNRLLLHASSLELTLPDRSRKTFTAPLAEDFHL